jgi:NAD(P) transhydrogenase subunit alpha
MKIGVIRESRPDERRVASTPANVEQFIKLGYEVLVDPGAGAQAGFPDAAYEAAGATLGQAAGADIVLSINVPTDEQLALMSTQTTLISMISPALNPDTLTRLNSHGLTAFSMDAVPRISRAQSLDVLSSMANIAGYRAVIEAANVFGRFFTGQVTAAGKVPPARVLVCGAGVAGLAAIGVAGSMGAVVFSTDPRPEVADQVKSLGGEYIPVEAADVAVSTTGYAKEMSDDYNARAAAMYAEQCTKVDIIITTALIPGKPAPRLITADMVASMAPGSVIVDMAASNGGNVEGSVAGEKVISANGVTILGYTDLAGRLPAQASQLYGTNLLNLLKLMTPEKDGALVLDWDDVVQRAITVVRGGDVTWPPPQVAVSAAPAVVAAEPAPPPIPKPPMTSSRRFQIVGLLAALLFLAGAFAPSALLGHLTVFSLAIVIGYYVIGHVHHALHTPLMSVTNAISGIIIVGALLQIGHNNLAISILSAAAILLASINIFGGFAVTRRMLSMFSRS